MGRQVDDDGIPLDFENPEPPFAPVNKGRYIKAQTLDVEAQERLKSFEQWKAKQALRPDAARLDPQGTEKPLTRIVHHVKRDGCLRGPGFPLVNPELVQANGERVPLIDPPKQVNLAGQMAQGKYDLPDISAAQKVAALHEEYKSCALQANPVKLGRMTDIQNELDDLGYILVRRYVTSNQGGSEQLMLCKIVLSS